MDISPMTTMTTLEILKGIRKILNSPKRWVKKELKTNGPDGKPSYCIVGALGKVVSGKDEFGYSLVSKEQVKEITEAMNIKYTEFKRWNDLVSYNNDYKLTYSGMRARLDRAIKRLEAKVKGE